MNLYIVKNVSIYWAHQPIYVVGHNQFLVPAEHQCKKNTKGLSHFFVDAQLAPTPDHSVITAVTAVQMIFLRT